MFKSPTPDDVIRIMGKLQPQGSNLPVRLEVRARRAFTPDDGEPPQSGYRADSGNGPIPLFLLFR